jgi:hypothetical protein
MSYSLRKYGTIVSKCGKVEIRKLKPTQLLKNLKIDTPQIQRNIVMEHVRAIADSILKNPGILHDNRILIGIHSNSYYIIDGQHRICAIQFIQDNYPAFVFEDEICVYFKVCDTLDEISETYRLVNRNFPLDEFQKYLIDNTTLSEHMFYNTLEKHFQSNYNKYISKKNSKVPNINLEQILRLIMQQKINGKSVYNNSNLTTPESIVTWIETINDKVKHTFNNLIHEVISKKRKPSECDKKYLKYNQLIIQKSSKPLYLGLPVNWYKLIEDINYPLVFPHYQIYNKKTVDDCVWNTYYPTKEYGLCYCCKINMIQRNNCHMGHVMAKRHGGLYTVDNLRPICPNCNTVMSSKNLYEFQTELMSSRNDVNGQDSDNDNEFPVIHPEESVLNYSHSPMEID